MNRAFAAALLACGVVFGSAGAQAAMAPTIGAPLAAPATAALQTGVEDVQWRRGGGGWRRGHGFRRGPGWRRGFAGPPPRYWAGPRYVYAGPRFARGPVCRTIWVERWRPRLGGWVTVPVRRCRY